MSELRIFSATLMRTCQKFKSAARRFRTSEKSLTVSEKCVDRIVFYHSFIAASHHHFHAEQRHIHIAADDIAHHIQRNKQG